VRARPAHARVPLPVDCMYGTVVAHLALGDRLCAAHAPFFWLCSRLFCVSTMIMAVLSADRNAYRAACTRPAAPPRATQLRIHVLPLCDESCAVSSSRSFAGRCVLFGVDEGVCKRVFGACSPATHGAQCTIVQTRRHLSHASVYMSRPCGFNFVRIQPGFCPHRAAFCMVLCG
jgi:hypothetical protein